MWNIILCPDSLHFQCFAFRTLLWEVLCISFMNLNFQAWVMALAFNIRASLLHICWLWEEYLIFCIPSNFLTFLESLVLWWCVGQYVLFQKKTWEQMPAREKAFIIYCVGAIVLVWHLFLLGSQFHLGKVLSLWKLGRESWKATTSSIDTNTHSSTLNGKNVTKIVDAKHLFINWWMRLKTHQKKTLLVATFRWFCLRVHKFHMGANIIASSSRMFTTSEQRSREALAVPQRAQNSVQPEEQRWLLHSWEGMWRECTEVSCWGHSWIAGEQLKNSGQPLNEQEYFSKECTRKLQTWRKCRTCTHKD